MPSTDGPTDRLRGESSGDSVSERLGKMSGWQKRGGIMVMSYSIFKIMSQKPGEVGVRSRAMLLDPGPDVVVADEAHLLKNEEAQVHGVDHTGTSYVRRSFSHRRRVCFRMHGPPLFFGKAVLVSFRRWFFHVHPGVI